MATHIERRGEQALARELREDAAPEPDVHDHAHAPPVAVAAAAACTRLRAREQRVQAPRGVSELDGAREEVAQEYCEREVERAGRGGVGARGEDGVGLGPAGACRDEEALEGREGARVGESGLGLWGVGGAPAW